MALSVIIRTIKTQTGGTVTISNQLIESHLATIGSTDIVVREQVFEFWHQARVNNQFTDEQYDYLLLAAKQLLFKSIEYKSDYQVLTRSYSLLLIDCLLQADNQYDIYLDNQIEQLAMVIIDYIQLETDYRGFDEKVGWIHTMAHLSDCIGTLATSPKVCDNSKLLLLKKLLNLVDEQSCDFAFLEDERVARALNLFPKQFEGTIFEWFKSRQKYVKDNFRTQTDRHLATAKYRLVIKALLRYQSKQNELILLLDSLY